MLEHCIEDAASCCIAVCCGVLQRVAVFSSVLQCVMCVMSYCIYMYAAVHMKEKYIQDAASCCSVLQCVAVCCSVLQCVAACCSV